jgi:potassium-transporting ATPase KdpC subunit
MKLFYRSLMATLILALITCGAYPLLVWGLGQALFPAKANGGILRRNGSAVGAELIGQGFTKPEYFHGRPSAAGDKGYDAANSAGSNLGPTNQKFADTLKANVDSVLKYNPGLKPGEVPNDLVTASGSGLDPHISPDGAAVQVERVSKARGAPREAIQLLVEEHTEGPQWGIFGEPVVNVLRLNLALDEKYPKK